MSGALPSSTATRPSGWRAWTLVALIVLNAGWMVFDGARALVVGDYVTPSDGRHAGQLGPWSGLVARA